MNILYYKKSIDELNKLIYTCSKLLNLNHPYIYYYIHDKTTFRMYDQDMKIVSYDKRDAGLDFKRNVAFVKKENSIYVNAKSLSNDVESKVFAIRTIRGVYQYKQAFHFINSKQIEVSEIIATQWEYCFMPAKGQNDYLATSPVELDKNAFAALIMGTIYNIGVKYDFDTNLASKFATYNEILIEIEKIYSTSMIKSIYDNYDMKNAKKMP